MVAIEPEPYLRERAERAARRAPVAVSVMDGLADRLPLEDGSVDAAVVALVLCSVPDQSVALRELRRVIRPGGELRFYEHVVAHEPRLAAVQRFVERSGFWPFIAGGTAHPRHGSFAGVAAVADVRRIT